MPIFLRSFLTTSFQFCRGRPGLLKPSGSHVRACRGSLWWSIHERWSRYHLFTLFGMLSPPHGGIMRIRHALVSTDNRKFAEKNRSNYNSYCMSWTTWEIQVCVNAKYNIVRGCSPGGKAPCSQCTAGLEKQAKNLKIGFRVESDYKLGK